MTQIYHHLLYIIAVFQVTVSVVESGSRSYHAINTLMTWANAEMTCKRQYTDLAVVITELDWLRFQKEAKAKAVTNGWIGLSNDVRSWRWSYKNTIMTQTNWYSGQPDNNAGHQSCGSMDATGFWWDDVCTTQKPFLCFDANNKNNPFIWISKPTLTWLDAQAYCQSNYTDLASVNNKTDTLLLKALAQTSSWFGLFRDRWKWVDGTNASTVSWVTNRPIGGGRDCAFYYQDKTVIDEPCTTLLPFFCHIIVPATEKQIIQVNVKTDHNVYDPGVQSNILEMMHQQLENLDLAENSTLSWRVQNSGRTFNQKPEEVVEQVANPTEIVCEP